MDAIKRFIEKLSKAGDIVWPNVTTEASGFRSGEQQVLWSQISSIAAFKRDLLTFDDIWFQLETPDGHVLVCEEQPGFKEWELALTEQFPSVVGWREHVVQPPFAENFTVLYSRT